VVDGSDLVHVAYEDSRAREVLYQSFTPGSAGTPELVDDGARDGERPHWVGAGLALWLDGTPRVAYQDGSTSDVMVSTRGNGWVRKALAAGPALDGLHLAAPARGAGPLVWGAFDATVDGVRRLVTEKAP
jgi:hypothetical protein